MAPSSLMCCLLLFLLLLLLHPHSTTAQTYSNITLGSTLTPLGQNGQNSSWRSPSGDFAFGFHPLETDGTLFLLAIWFDKTTNKTVVWFANGDKPVQAGSRAELTTGGQLSLKDHNGREVWNAGVSNAAYAAMLDTGNLVLARNSAAMPIWQSFSSPTDTILPTQTLGLGSRLMSRLTDTDYSGGRFQLDIQTDGNLVFYPRAIPTGNQYSPYWASNTIGSGTQLVFNVSGGIYLALKNDTRFSFTSGRVNLMGESYQRGTLDPDGVFRQYVYRDERWRAVDFVPFDICQAITTSTGSGACGFNSYCKSSGSGIQRADCECPPQYSFLDPSRKYKGCVPDFAAQSCRADESSLFEFAEMANLDWPLSDYELYNPMDEEQCRSECLSDCFCAVAIYNGGNCWKKKLPLSNGKMGGYVQRVALIKVPKGNSSHHRRRACFGSEA